MLHFADYQSKLNKSNKKDHLIIYGAGTLGKVTLQTLKKHNLDVDFFCDSDVRKHHLKVDFFIIFFQLMMVVLFL